MTDWRANLVDDDAAAMLARAGIRVVQDRCMMPEHRRLLGAA